MASLDAVKNFAKVTVSTGYDASATSIALTSGHGAKLPAPATDGAFNVVWWNSTDYSDPSDDPNVEIVRVTARSTDTLTVTRAQESTSATTKNTGSKTYKMILSLTSKMITDIQTAKCGTATRAGNTASGTQTIAHGLGRTPSLVRIFANFSNTATMMVSSGSYNGTTTACSFINYIDATSYEGGTSSTNIIVLEKGGALNSQVATIAIDGTNITLTWTLAGTGPGANDMNLEWSVQ